MLLFHPGKDQDVVQVDHHDTFHYEVPEDVVHHGLEGGWAVSHAKEYYQGFEQALIGPEGCFPLISRLNADVVEIPTNVQLGKVSVSASKVRRPELSQLSLCSEFDKENSIEFPLDFLHYLYNYYMVCVLFSHTYYVTHHVTSCDVML